MPERILWLVDEYVMKSEPPERLVPIIKRAHKPYTKFRTNGGSVTGPQRKVMSIPMSTSILSNPLPKEHCDSRMTLQGR
jgi:hypothetical protein